MYPPNLNVAQVFWIRKGIKRGILRGSEIGATHGSPVQEGRRSDQVNREEGREENAKTGYGRERTKSPKVKTAGERILIGSGERGHPRMPHEYPNDMDIRVNVDEHG